MIFSTNESHKWQEFWKGTPLKHDLGYRNQTQLDADFILAFEWYAKECNRTSFYDAFMKWVLETKEYKYEGISYEWYTYRRLSVHCCNQGLPLLDKLPKADEYVESQQFPLDFLNLVYEYRKVKLKQEIEDEKTIHELFMGKDVYELVTKYVKIDKNLLTRKFEVDNVALQSFKDQFKEII